MTSTMVLRPYQVEAVERLKIEKRLMLTDAPGLGKTPQSVFASTPPCLIAVPNDAVEQWREWLCGEDEKSLERNDGEIIPNVDGTIVACQGARYLKNRALRERADWTVINHDMIRTHAERLKRYHYNTLIIDESHHFKNHASMTARAGVQLAQRVENCFLLTATPIKKEVDDLYMQFRFLHPDLFKSYNAFVKYYCLVDEDEWGVHVLGVKKKTRQELIELLDVMRIGRSYKDVGRFLPDVIEKFITIELPPSIQKIYNDAVDKYKVEELEHRYVNAMQVYHELRQIVTGSFKYEAVANILADEVRKAVVFSWYQETCEAIVRRVGGDMQMINGTVKDMVERRRRALHKGHVSATIATMAEAIDLSDARVVVFAEEDWTPGSNYQALSRVRRDRNDDGKDTDPVIVYYVHCKKTIDQVIHRRSKSRSGTIRDVVREALYI